MHMEVPVKPEFLVFLLLTPVTCPADEAVSKWIDEHGQVHYGDEWTMGRTGGTTTLLIPDTFDEAEYKAAVARYAVYEKELKARRREREKLARKPRRNGGKRPLSDAEKYDLYLEQEEKKRQAELKRRRQRRMEERRRWEMGCNDSRNAVRKACR